MTANRARNARRSEDLGTAKAFVALSTPPVIFVLTTLVVVPFVAFVAASANDLGSGGGKVARTDGGRKFYAFCVGINNYDSNSGVANLSYAGADAVGVAETLLQDWKYDEVFVVADCEEAKKLAVRFPKNATVSDNTKHDAIKVLAQDFLNKANGYDDVIVIYFACHGIGGGGVPKIAASDYQAVNGKHATVEVDQLLDWLNEKGFTHRTLIIDACRVPPNRQAQATPVGFVDFINGRQGHLSTFVMLSCDKNKLAYEDIKLGHGRFTWLLIKRLADRAKDQDGVELSGNAFNFIAQEFPKQKLWPQQMPYHQSVGTQVTILAARDEALAEKQAANPQVGEKLAATNDRVYEKGCALYDAHRLDEAHSTFAECLGDFPSDAKLDAVLKEKKARLLGELAKTHYRLAKKTESRVLRVEAQGLDPNLTSLLELKAFELQDSGDDAAAFKAFSLAEEQLSSTKRPAHYFQARFADCLVSLGQLRDAATMYLEAARSAVEINQFLFAATYLKSSVSASARNGDYEQARITVDDVAQRSEKSFDADSLAGTPLLDALAILAGELGDYASAEEYAERSLVCFKRFAASKERDIETLRRMNVLANLYFRNGRYAEAEGMHKETLDLRRAVLGSEHREYFESVNNLAVVYAHHGQRDLALPLFKEAAAGFQTYLGPDSRELFRELANLSDDEARVIGFDEAKARLAKLFPKSGSESGLPSALAVNSPAWLRDQREISKSWTEHRLDVVLGWNDKLSPGAQRELQSAVDAFRAGDAKSAKFRFAIAQRANKALPVPEVLMARLCFAVNDEKLLKVGREFLDQAVDKHPTSPEAYMILGNLALLEGRLADSELHFARAEKLADGPTTAAWTDNQKETFLKNVYGGRVSIWEQRQNWSRGLNEIDTWLALDETDSAALYRKARMTFLQDPKSAKNVADARALFDEAYKFAIQDVKSRDELPAIPPTELALIELQTATGNLDKARDEIKLIDGKSAEFTLDKNRKEGSRVYSTLSQWYLGQGEFEKATEYANKATAIDKDSPALKQLTAVLYYFANNYDAAEKEFTAMHQDSPQDFFAANYLALTLIEGKGADGKPDPVKQAKAVQVAELSARLNPKSPVALATLAWCYFNTGKLGEAAQIFAAFEQQQNMEISADTAFYMAKTYAALPSAQFPQALSRSKQLLETVVKTGGAFKYRKEAEQMFVGFGGELPTPNLSPSTNRNDILPRLPFDNPPAPRPKMPPNVREDEGAKPKSGDRPTLPRTNLEVRK